jgi:CubicO group peptidase (beta-lactamase class C family)
MADFRPGLVVGVMALAGAVGCKGSSATPGGGTHTGDSGAPALDGGRDSGGTINASYDFSALDAEEFGGSWKTDGVVIMVGGQVVYEKYGPGWTATMPHFVYSVSKTIASALVGLAVSDGLMKVTDSICAYVTDPNDGGTSLCDTTIGQLLQFSSGLQWDENTADQASSNYLQMFFGTVPDMGAYAASQPRALDAGAAFNYSSGDTQLLALAFKNALKGQDPRAYAKTKLFTPLGITSGLLEEDLAGTPILANYCYLTARDLAKFAELYADDGMAGGAQVLPASWITYTTTPASTMTTPISRAMEGGVLPGGSFGAGMWLNVTSPTASPDTWEYPDAPPDEYDSEGHFGQIASVVPSRHLVIARVGSDISPTYSADAMIKLAVAAVDAASEGGSK